MVKLIEKPQEIKVSANAGGMPLSLARNGKREKIVGIYDNWRLTDGWWGRQIERHYFRVKTSKGLVCEIYHDVTSNHWYLSRVHN